jgi:hypothetical protein
MNDEVIPHIYNISALLSESHSTNKNYELGFSWPAVFEAAAAAASASSCFLQTLAAY